MKDYDQSRVFAPLFNTPHLAVALLDKSFNYIQVNDAYAQAAQQHPSFFPGKNHLALYPSETELLFRQALESGQPIHATGPQFGHEGGVLTHWEWSLVPILDALGEIDIFLFTLKNITLRVHAERELSMANESMIYIMESISSCIYFLNEDFVFTYANKAAEKYLKSIHKADLIGKCIWDAFPKLKDTIANEKYHTALQRGTPEHFEFRSPYTDQWTDVYVYPTPQGISVFFNDITAKKEAELELVRSQKIFSAIFHTSPTIKSIRCLKTDRYVEVNDAWIKAIGYTREEVIGKTPKEMQLPVTPGAVTMTQVFQERQLPFTGYPRVFRTKSGGIREGLTAASIIDINGEECALVTTTDVTELRALEREMQRLDRLNLIGQMASGVAHEIRNPLTVVRGLLQLLCGKYQDSAYQFNVMISELDRANVIITEFLALAKTKPDEQKLGNVNGVIERIFPMLKARASEFHRELCLGLSDIPEVLISEPEMRQILLNITINAIEASLQGTRVVISTYQSESEVVVAVTNIGPAITPEAKKLLGTPFFTTKDHGTGLGLAISYNLAKLHGGSIEVESDDTKTTFFVKLPIPTNK